MRVNESFPQVLADPNLGGVSYLWPVCSLVGPPPAGQPLEGLRASPPPCMDQVLSSVLLLAGVGWLAVDVVPRLVESKLLPRVQQRHHDVVLTSLLCAMAVGLMAVCHRTKTFPLLGALLAPAPPLKVFGALSNGRLVVSQKAPSSPASPFAASPQSTTCGRTKSSGSSTRSSDSSTAPPSPSRCPPPTHSSCE